MTITYEQAWVGVGLLGQGVFTARFVVQWFASERKKETVVPVAFWWLSLAGGLVTLTYAIHLQSLSFSMGQGMGLFVYVRNLMLTRKARQRAEKRQRRAAAASASAEPGEAAAPGSPALNGPHRRDAARAKAGPR